MSDVKQNAPMYPSMATNFFEKTEHGLLSEQELLTYYFNPLYEGADDFVDKFIQVREIVVHILSIFRTKSTPTDHYFTFWNDIVSYQMVLWLWRQMKRPMRINWSKRERKLGRNSIKPAISRWEYCAFHESLFRVAVQKIKKELAKWHLQRFNFLVRNPGKLKNCWQKIERLREGNCVRNRKRDL